MDRRHNFQTIAWFNDLRQRGLLDLDPPYQRRSVWNQRFKDYFVETVLLNYPAPAIFLYEDISPEGRSIQHVVDGKQRLTTIFEFIDGRFPVSEASVMDSVRGIYFRNLSDDLKRRLWSYQLFVEYVPKDDERVIDAIFDRINRNVAKLTPQELRHARFDGEFTKTAEELTEWMEQALPKNFPRIAPQSRKQMKDVELVAQLLLLTESGTRGYSQADLDEAFSLRDEEWDRRTDVEDRFRRVVASINDVVTAPFSGEDLAGSRLRNQADFYSLYGAVLDLMRDGTLPTPIDTEKRLGRFVGALDNPLAVEQSPELAAYVDAGSSASNDKGARETRIRVMKLAILKQLPI